MSNKTNGALGSIRAITVATVASILAISASAGAQEPEKIKVVESIQLDAPVAKVWSVVGNFAAPEWHPVVKKATTSEGNTPGSQRHIDVGGPVLVETLVRHNGEKHSLTYKILDNGSNQKILPVKGYVSTIQVKPSGNGSLVVWSSKFAPTPGTDPAEAKKAIAGVYRGGLDNLPKIVANP